MLDYGGSLERETPIRKKKGPFVFAAESLGRPEILRHQQRLLGQYRVPARAKKLLLLPETYLKPFRENAAQDDLLLRIERRSDVHICCYGLAFAIVPHELLDVYPLSQTEHSLSPTAATISNALARIISYLKAADYKNCIFVAQAPWQLKIARSIKIKFRRKMKVRILETEIIDQKLLSQILSAFRQESRR
jgi:predicted RNA-binding protein